MGVFKQAASAGAFSKPGSVQQAKGQGWQPSLNGDSADQFLKKKSQQPMSDADKSTYLGRGRSSLLGG